MTRYKGTIFGYNYNGEFDTVEEFQAWLEPKLYRHLLDPSNPATPVVMKVLGITNLSESTAALAESIDSRLSKVESDVSAIKKG